MPNFAFVLFFPLCSMYDTTVSNGILSRSDLFVYVSSLGVVILLSTNIGISFASLHDAWVISEQIFAGR